MLQHRRCPNFYCRNVPRRRAVTVKYSNNISSVGRKSTVRRNKMTLKTQSTESKVLFTVRLASLLDDQWAVEKREDSQLGFYAVFSLILLVIVLFVINMITK